MVLRKGYPYTIETFVLPHTTNKTHAVDQRYSRYAAQTPSKCVKLRKSTSPGIEVLESRSRWCQVLCSLRNDPLLRNTAASSRFRGWCGKSRRSFALFGIVETGDRCLPCARDSSVSHDWFSLCNAKHIVAQIARAVKLAHPCLEIFCVSYKSTRVN